MTGAHTNRTHIVGALPQNHPEQRGTRVGPGRTPTAQPCPQGRAVGGPKNASRATPQRENQDPIPRLDYQQQRTHGPTEHPKKTRLSPAPQSARFPTFHQRFPTRGPVPYG